MSCRVQGWSVEVRLEYQTAELGLHLMAIETYEGWDHYCLRVRSLQRQTLKQSLMFRIFIREFSWDQHLGRKRRESRMGPREKPTDSTRSSAAEMAMTPGRVSGVGSLYFCCRLSLYVGHSGNRCDLGPGSSPPPGQSLKGLTGCPLVALPGAGTNHSLKEHLGN